MENHGLEYYMEIGAISMVGVDEDGEILFKINESAKTLAPQLWNAHEEYINGTLVELLEKDLISIEYNENLEATVSLSEEGYEIVKSMGLLPLEDE